MQAITTRYFGAGNVRGSRIKATAAAGSVTLHWDDSMNPEQNHCAAAKQLALKFGWTYGTYRSGALPDGTRVWVCADHDSREGRDHFELSTQETV